MHALREGAPAVTIYFTSDLHVGHESVAGHRGMAADEHDARVSWMLHTANKRDQVWILGDLSAGGRAAEENALTMIAEAKECTRAEFHLIPGNHDSVHPQHEKGFRRLPRFLEVFDSVQPFGWRKIAGHRVLLSHYPYTKDHTDTPRHVQWRMKDMGKWLLHGHTHQPEPLSEWSGSASEINVGVDAWDFSLVSAERLADIILNP